MISLLIILTLFFITFFITIGSIVFKLFSRCGNPFYHITNITKCCTLKIQNKKWNKNKMFSKHYEIKDTNLKDKSISLINFSYSGFDIKNVKLIIRIINNQIKDNYVLLKNDSHQSWNINSIKGILDIHSDKSKYQDNNMDKNLTFEIYPPIPEKSNFEIYAKKIYF